MIISISTKFVECCGGRSSGRSSGGWGASNGRVHYTFRNGVQVYGTGSFRPRSVTVGVSIPFGRKRRATEAENKNETDSCVSCLGVDDFKNYNGRVYDVAQKTKADLVFKAQFKKEVRSVSHESIEYTVLDVYRSPSDEKIEPGESFSVDVDLAYCECLPDIAKGEFIFTGKRENNGKLVMNGDLIKM